MTIKDILETRGTITAIAKTKAVSESQLHRIKNGQCKPTLETFCAICWAVGENPAVILASEPCYKDHTI